MSYKLILKPGFFKIPVRQDALDNLGGSEDTEVVMQLVMDSDVGQSAVNVNIWGKGGGT